MILDVTEFEADEIRKAIKERLKYLRKAHRTGVGDGILEKMVACEAVLGEITTNRSSCYCCREGACDDGCLCNGR